MFIFTAISVIGGAVVSIGSGTVAKVALNAIVPIASKGSVEILRKIGVMAISGAVAAVAAREYQKKVEDVEKGVKVIAEAIETKKKLAAEDEA